MSLIYKTLHWLEEYFSVNTGYIYNRVHKSGIWRKAEGRLSLSEYFQKQMYLSEHKIIEHLPSIYETLSTIPNMCVCKQYIHMYIHSWPRYAN